MANIHRGSHEDRFLGDILSVISYPLKPPNNKVQVKIVLNAITIVFHAGGQLFGNRFLGLVELSVLGPDFKRVFKVSRCE